MIKLSINVKIFVLILLIYNHLFGKMCHKQVTKISHNWLEHHATNCIIKLTDQSKRRKNIVKFNLVINWTQLIKRQVLAVDLLCVKVLDKSSWWLDLQLCNSNITLNCKKRTTQTSTSSQSLSYASKLVQTNS